MNKLKNQGSGGEQCCIVLVCSIRKASRSGSESSLWVRHRSAMSRIRRDCNARSVPAKLSYGASLLREASYLL